MDNELKIIMENATLRMETKTPMDILSFLEMTCSAQLAALRNFTDSVPLEHRHTLRDDIYDKYNAAVSRVLEQFAPEIEVNPDLTAQAMLDAENKFINKKYKEMKK